MRVTHPRLTSPALALTAAAALAACSGAAATPAHPTVAASKAAAVSPTPSAPAQQALAAYTAMWADVRDVSLTSNYQDPRLGNHTQGQPLATFRQNISVDQAHGVVGRGAPVLHPGVVTATATAVTLLDCLDDTHWLKYYAATGTPIDNVPGGHRSVAATVTDENGTWKVTALDVKAEGTC